MSHKYYFKDDVVILFKPGFNTYSGCGVNSQVILDGYICYLAKFQDRRCNSIKFAIDCALHKQKLAIKKNMNIGQRIRSIAKLLELKRIAEEDRDLP